MSNKNKNIVKDVEKDFRKKAIKKYHSNNRSEFTSLFCVICYAVVFGLISIINDSVFFSLILSIFSFAITFGFELMDWLKYKLKQSPFWKNFFTFYTNAILVGTLFFLIIIAPLSIWAKFDAEAFKQFTLNIDSHIPNIITSITFVAYFISFYLRNYFINRDAFIASMSK